MAGCSVIAVDGFFIRGTIALAVMPIFPFRFTAARATGYVLAIAGTILGSIALSPLRTFVDLSNLSSLYVLGVVAIGVKYGRGAAVSAAFVGSLCFAYVFVPPHLSLAITEAQYLLTAVIMLTVALMVGHLTSQLRQHADHAERKSIESAKLCGLAQSLGGALTRDEVLRSAGEFLSSSVGASEIHVVPAGAEDADRGSRYPDLARECANRNQLLTTAVGSGRMQAYVPLNAASGMQGVVVFEADASVLGSRRVMEYIETAASVLAVALERSHFVEKARDTEVRHAAESLRSSILSALSHDLRTPLTVLVGMTETLANTKVSEERQKHLLEAIRNQALLISQQMTNLLEMAKLSCGPHQINKAWQPVEEVLGATIQQVRVQWKDREVSVDLERGLPPINIDAVLIERVLWNLLENAIKYSPADSPIEVAARLSGNEVEVSVCDAGPGLPDQDPERLFDRFQRGRAESDIPGVGLGLSIAKTIVEAHGGVIKAENRYGGGSCFRIRLPIGDVPDFKDLEPAS